MLAKYWRIRNKDAGASHWSFAYTAIQLKNTSDVDITSQATITGTNNVADAFDGNVNTYWESVTYLADGVSHTGKQYAKFEFPSDVEIGSVYVEPKFNNSANLLIEYSNDNNVWFTIATGFTDKTSAARTITVPASPVNTPHRFWAIRVLDTLSPSYCYMRNALFMDANNVQLTKNVYSLGLTGTNSTETIQATLTDETTSMFTFATVANKTTVAGLEFGFDGALNAATINQIGAYCDAGVPTTLAIVHVDGYNSTYSPKTFSIAYCDELTMHPTTGYFGAFDWTDIACVDSETVWTSRVSLVGLNTTAPYKLDNPAALTIDKVSGTYVTGSTVTLTASRASNVYYTLDGSVPTLASTLYTGPIALPGSCTLKAIAQATDTSVVSAVSTKTYVVSDIAPIVTISTPNMGRVLSNSGLITLSAPGATNIYYTTNGTTPTTASTVYSNPFTISSDSTIKAISKNSLAAVSEVSTLLVKTGPTVTLPSGTVCGIIVPKFNCYWNDYFYTIDGSEPTIASANGSIVIPDGQTVTLKVLPRDTDYGVFGDVVTTTVTGATAVKFWRMRAYSASNYNVTGYKRLEWRAFTGGPNLVIAPNGVIVAGSKLSTSPKIGLNLFTEGSGFTGYAWYSTNSQAPYVTVAFDTPQVISEVLIDLVGVDSTWWPRTIEMESSYDGKTWAKRGTANISTAATYRAFGVSGIAVMPITLPDTPDTYAPTACLSLPTGAYPPNTAIKAYSSDEYGYLYYTVDGTTPTDLSTPISNGSSITLDTAKTIKLIAKDYAGNFSAVYTAAYTVKRAFKFFRYTYTSPYSGYRFNTLELYSDNGGPNIATPANVAVFSGSSVLSGTAVSAASFDSTSGATAQIVQNFYAQVEFIAPTEVVDIRLDCGNNSSLWAAGIKLEVSDDGTTWLQVLSKNIGSDEFQAWGAYGVFYARLLPVVDTVKPIVSFSRTGTYSPLEPVILSANKIAKISYTLQYLGYNFTNQTTNPVNLTQNMTVIATATDLAGNVSDTVTQSFVFEPKYTYWRIGFLYSKAGTYANSAIRKLEMRDTMDGPNIVTTASGAIVTCSGVAGITLANFENPNVGLSYTTTQGYVTVQFPTPKIIKEFVLDVVGLVTANYRPNTVTLQCSKDGITWQTNMDYYLDNAHSFLLTNVLAIASAVGEARVLATKPTGTYGAGLTVKFETNQPGKYLVYREDGQEPVISSNNNYSSPTFQWTPSSTLTVASGIKTIQLKAYNSNVNSAGPTASFVYTIDTLAPGINFLPVSGLVSENTTVELFATEAATIYYTTDGSTPTTASSVYSTAIDIGTGMKIKAIAKDSFNNVSGVASSGYSTLSGAPYVSASRASGDHLTGSTVELVATIQSTIYYTLDGSTPTTGSTVYTVPLVLDVNKTVKALAVSTNFGLPSEVETFEYTVDIILTHKYWRYKILKPRTKGYFYSQIWGLELYETVGGANIFTTANVASMLNTASYGDYIVTPARNGATPVDATQLLTASLPAVTIEFTVPRKVKEFKIRCHQFDMQQWPDAVQFQWSDNNIDWNSMAIYGLWDTWADWARGSALNRIQKELVYMGAAPVISWVTPPGEITSGWGAIVASTNADDKLIYTLDGTEPTLYNGTAIVQDQYGGIDMRLISIGGTQRIRVKSMSSTGAMSNELDATFTRDNAAPELSFGDPPGMYGINKAITINATDYSPYTIYYTLDDTMATNMSTVYTGPIVLTSTTIIRAIGIDIRGNESWELNGFFEIDPIVPVITFDRLDGTVPVGTSLGITADIAVMEILYSLDDSTPTISYTGPFVLPNGISNVRAIGYTQYNQSAPIMGRFNVTNSNMKLILPTGLASEMPVKGSGVLMPLDKNTFFASDDGGNIKALTDIYVGEHQPLAGTRLWHDTSSMTVKYNDGRAWVQAVENATLAPVRAKNFGGFVESLDYNLDPGIYTSNKTIVLSGSLGSEVRYTLDGTDPTMSSTLYTTPIPMFTGTLNAIVVSQPTNIVSLDYVVISTYTGLGVTYATVKTDDPLVVIDNITAGVAITRFKSGGQIANALLENTYDRDLSPLGTLWAFANHNGNPAVLTATDYALYNFTYFTPATNSNPPSIEGLTGVCYIPEEAMYFDIKFTYWGQGSAEAGVVTYERAILPVIKEKIFFTDAGLYGSDDQIVLSSSNGTEIYYSTDGSVPSVLYTGPIAMFSGRLRASIPTHTVSVNYALNPNLRWVDITAPMFWSTDVIDPMCEYDGTKWIGIDNGVNSGMDHVVLFPVGTSGEAYYLNNPTVDAATYASMTQWSKGLHFSKLRITCDGDTPDVDIKDNDTTLLQVSNYVSGSDIVVPWAGTGEFIFDLGCIYVHHGNEPTIVTKVEIRTDQPMPDSFKANVSSGTYGSTQTIILTSSNGLEILYSLDGTTPSILYTGPIAMFTGTLKAATSQATMQLELVLDVNLMWKDITDPAFWYSPEAVASGNHYGIFADGVWVPTSGEVWLWTPYSIDAAGNNPVDVYAADYANLSFWSKELRFSALRATFDSMPGSSITLRVRDINSDAIISSEPATSAVANTITWYGSDSYYNNMQSFDIWESSGTLNNVSKIEILTSMPVVKPVRYLKAGINDLTFDNVDFSNAIDSISPSVALTRAGTGLLYNTRSEVAYVTNVSPAGVKFAFSAIGQNAAIPSITTTLLEAGTITPVFTDMKTACVSTNNLVGRTGVMYLEAENTYIDILFTRWSTVQGTGGFTYTRAQAAVLTSEVTIIDGSQPADQGGVFTIDGIQYVPGVYQIPRGSHTLAFTSQFPNGTNYANIGYSYDILNGFYSTSNNAFALGEVATGVFNITGPVAIQYKTIID